MIYRPGDLFVMFDNRNMSACQPAYNFEPANADAKLSGPQCSAHSEDFCFFCAYERDPNAEHGSTSDLYASLTGLVETMTAQSREFPAIVSAVHGAYESQIKQLIDDPTFGHAPTWSKRAISRHLMYSNQFKSVFQEGVTQIFHSLVDSHNRHMKDAATGQIIESERMALMSTIQSLIKWEQHMRKGAAK